MLRNLLKKQKGFTIIEVMIVLAIAGLILVVVLVAVPQLQRNQRNSARQSILGRMDTELSNYIGNNGGNIPADQNELDDVSNRYLSNVNVDDPSSGSPFTLTYVGTPDLDSNGISKDAAEADASYTPGYSCDGEKLATANNRNYALYTKLEGGAIYCLDNL